MEQAFVQRGKSLVENIYPERGTNADAFIAMATHHASVAVSGMPPDKLLDILHYTDGYGDMSDDDRVALFVQLGDIVAGDKGFGFSTRDTVTGRDLYARWHEVLALVDGTCRTHLYPLGTISEAWQIFVADNLEFRLGVAIGAVVAQRWTEESTDPFATPTLDTWKNCQRPALVCVLGQKNCCAGVRWNLSWPLPSLRELPVLATMRLT